MKISLISDTHGHLDQNICDHLLESDIILHAGDIGNLKLIDRLTEIAPVHAVYGNIDDHIIRRTYPENLNLNLSGIKILMTHIGGYPGRYPARIKSLIQIHQPDLFICGHSHILRIMPDPKNKLIHMNPGACGHHGFHLIRTLIQFQILNGKIQHVQVVELGKRGALTSEPNIIAS